jgi:tryptophan halogenase
MSEGIRNVVIAGGGTAGWMTAAAMAVTFGGRIRVTLVESDAIPTVGVGEATVPSIFTFHRLLKIAEPDFLKATMGTFKLGINFEGWKTPQTDYFHSFGDTGQGCWAAGFQHFWARGQREGIAAEYGEYCLELQAAKRNQFNLTSEAKLNYAYHLDAGLYAKYLRGVAEKHSARRIEGSIEQVILNPDSGYIDALRLADGQRIEGDLFIDCTGFRGLLIEEALKAGYDDWSHYLPCNRAVALQTEATEPPRPYTRAIAHDFGWQWRIPLQHRTGNGIVFCDKYVSEDEATATLLANVTGEHRTDPRLIKFTTGQRQKYWLKNCVAVGLSSGFIEPMESTSIHMIQQAIMWLLLMFPNDRIDPSVVEDYNQRIRREVLYIRDFIVLHYHLTERRGKPFWDYLATMPIPETLQHRLDTFKESAQVFKPQDDFFAENSWIQVMMGQGLMPESYHPIVDNMSKQELTHFLNVIRQQVQTGLSKMLPHEAFVERYMEIRTR